MKKFTFRAICLTLSAFALGGVNCNAADTDGLTFTKDGTTLTITGSGDLTTKSLEVAKEIATQVSESSYSTVIFKSGEEHCKIDNAALHAVLYPNTYFAEGATTYTDGNANTHITKLDLGDVTAASDFTFVTNNTGEIYKWSTLKLDEITLPLVEAKDGAVVLPASFFHYDNYGTLTALGTARYETIDGVYTTIPRPAKINVPEGYTALGESAFADLSNVTTYSLPSTLTSIGVKAFYQCTNLVDVALPEKLESIGDKAFHSCKNLPDVKFPSSLKSIGRSAYAICEKFLTVELNDGLEIIGNSAFYLASKNSTQKVLEVPASVKYIGPGAFNFRWYSDVYYYGEKAPLSPYGVVDENSAYSEAAFGSQLLCGNGGFDPSKLNTDGTTAGDITKGYASRENYYNTEYIAVLHFRSDISDDNAETFTDITRKYEHWLTEKTKPGTDEGTGEYYWYAASQKQVGQENEIPSFGGYGPGVKQIVNPGYVDVDLGDQLIWPSQSQFLRSYAVNSNGYKWDGVTTYRPELTEDEIALIKEQESSMSEYSDDDIKKVVYHGTRQFVLISRDITGPDPKIDPSITSGERWWTLCVPCDVRKSEVDRVFGQGTHLCLFSKVERGTENGTNYLHLYFQNDTYVAKYTRAADGTWTKDGDYTDEDPVVLYAHTPYMIYPTKRVDDGIGYVLSNYTLQAGDVLRTKVTASTDKTDYEYTSTYRMALTSTGSDVPSATTAPARAEAKASSNVMLPQYTYYFGKKSTNGNSQFWFYTGTTAKWSAYKCIVARYDGNGATDYADLFNSGKTDAKQLSFFGEDGNTDAIEHVVYHFGEDSDAPVYTLGGQMVNKANLTKGIYIQNGKKFVVK